MSRYLPPMTALAHAVLSRPPRPTPAVLSFDLSGPALPAGVALTRASDGGYIDAAGDLYTVAANQPRFSYDLVRGFPVGLLVEPASQNYARNDTWVGAVAATDPAALNTAKTADPGPHGTISRTCSFTYNGVPAGGVVGWQVASKTTVRGMSRLGLRLRLDNAAAAEQAYVRFNWTLGGALAPAAPGEALTISTFLSMLASLSLPQNATIRLHVQARDATNTYLDGTDFNVFPYPAAEPAMSFHKFAWSPPTGTAFMTAGLTVTCPAGEVLDITVGMAQPQMERRPSSSPFPTSPIVTNNTGYKVREADSLAVDVGEGGTYNVRWLSHWRNFDMVANTNSGVLALTPPALAFQQGIFGFSGLLISKGGLPPDPKRLRWPRPSTGPLVAYVEVRAGQSFLPATGEVSVKTGLPYTDDFALRCYEPDVDVVVTLPAQGSKVPLTIVGGRRVFVVGGEIKPTTAQTAGFHLSFKGQSEVIWIEGVHIDGWENPTKADAIDINGMLTVGDPATRPIFQPDVYIQAVRVSGVHSYTAGLHADVLQMQGPMGGLFIDRFTGYSSYQALFIPPQWFDGGTNAQPVPNPPQYGRHISRCNMVYRDYEPVSGVPDDAGSMFWFRDSWEQRLPPVAFDSFRSNQAYIPTELMDVWAAGRPAQTLATWVWPPATTGVTADVRGQLGDGDLTVHWPADMKIKGCVRSGLPPGGDFVPLDACGIGYVSPESGYLP